MKNIFIVLAACISIGLSANCQGTKVPAAVKSAFAIKYPGAANVKWGKENATEYEAEFKMNNTDISANFKKDGNWVVTETAISEGALPEKVRSAIMTKYPASTFSAVEKVEKPGNKIYYETVIKINGKKKEVEVNPDGSFIN